jgi:hypothetical protein
VAVASGDFNNDGWPDLALVSKSPGALYVLINQGDGGFAQSFSAGASPDSNFGVALGDLNGDGQLDIAVANTGLHALTVFLNSGGGRGFARYDFTPAIFSKTFQGTPVGPASIALGDFDKDGALDVALVVTDEYPVVTLNQCKPPPGQCALAEACVPVGGSCVNGGAPCCNFNACISGHCN